ncbi:fimbria/pilus outer membrane usher protein [Halotalea alkalilenta]|uniref:fimbria/pilus outer membrane usher protein n=1 Tax=Halotalea alkalilenta TaxID=376489 RepID=UPI00138E4F2D|nr:fimbria/pilus outer membrane usher protein [Halotalea alkalilenta]
MSRFSCNVCAPGILLWLAMAGVCTAQAVADTGGEPGAIDRDEGDAPAEDSSATAAVFNNGFLFGDAGKADLSRFSTTNPILAGRYESDIYTNSEWKGRFTLTFRNVEGEPQATLCFTRLMFDQFGIDTSLLPAVLRDDPNACEPLSSWIDDPNARVSFDPSSLRLDLIVPQTYLRRQARNYVSPSFWSEGITAANVGYNFNAYNTHYSAYQGGDFSSAYLGLDIGFSHAGWLFKHQGSLNWQDGSGYSGGTRWDSNRTYLQRGIASIKSQITLGDVSTNGEFFDSTRLRGVDLRTDDNMLPDGMRNYAPEIRGVAETNALVTIRQDGNVLYRVNVTPGPFLIDDLYPSGFGNELQVTISEADGRERTFAIPYASITQLLRVGHSRYALSVGRVDYDYLSDDSALYQATYQRGLTNLFTGYLGNTGFDGYNSVLLGTGWNTRWGAMSFDMTHAQTDLAGRSSYSGQRYRLSFNRMFARTSTNLVLAAYRYSTSDYFSVNDALYAHEYVRRGRDPQTMRRERNGLTATVSQNLPGGWGGIYFNARISDYWGEAGTQREYQINYNNMLGALSYSLSAGRVNERYDDSGTRYYLSFSYPLGTGGGASANLTGGLGFEDARYQESRIGINGAAGVDRNISYTASVSQQRGGDNAGSFGATYRAPYSTLNGNFSQSRSYRQASVGAMGAVVLHQGGATFAPQGTDTMVLVEAPDAEGALLPSAPGARIDANGYALVPYVRPYRLNTIEIDPLGTSANVELRNTVRQVAPFGGAITKVSFATVTGRSILIRAAHAGTAPLPFGAEVTDGEGQSVGVVGQGSTIFVRTDLMQGRLAVHLGAGESERCEIEYEVPEEQRKGDGYVMLEGVCE